MDVNAYESPTAPQTPTGAPLAERNAERPIGVSILAVLHVVGGLLLFGLQFLMFANLGAMEESLRSIGIPPALLVIGVMFLSVLTIGSGVGMWLGAKWGWWLAAFYYVYSVFRNGTALITFVLLADELEGAARGLDHYIMKHGIRIVIHLLLFVYFFKSNVLQFFGLKALSKLKAIGILVGICLAITVIASAASFASN